MAGIYKVNVKKNIEAVGGGKRFVDVKPDTTLIFRFAPPVREDGVFLYPAFNHYRFKDQDGNKTALADLALHGNDETGRVDYIAALARVLEELAVEKKDEKLAEIADNISGNTRVYMQGWVGERTDDGLKFDPAIKLAAFTEATSKRIARIAEKNELMGEAHFTDPEGGQAILVSRTGSGRNDTRYTEERSGQIAALDDIIPGWQSTLIEDVYDALMLNVMTRAAQREIAKISYPQLDWEYLYHHPELRV